MTIARVKTAPPPEVTAAIQGAPSLDDLARWELAVEHVTRIESKQQLQEFNGMLHAVAGFAASLEEYWRPKIAAADFVHKLLLKEYNPHKGRIAQLRSKIEARMKEFVNRARLEAERRERELIERAERQRQEIEAKAQALLMEGYVTEGRELLQHAQTETAVYVPESDLGLDGTHQREPWKITIEDKMAAVKAIANGEGPAGAEAAIELKVSTLREIARRNGGLNLPGVKAERDLSFAVQKGI